jgi:uncharacterized membrane protein YkvA (DUF1232 family)
MIDFFKQLLAFLKNVSQDQRIPEKDKKVLAALILMCVSPIDLIPDWIPVIGLLDDVVVAALILDYLFEVLDSEVLLTHWPWTLKRFLLLKRISRFISWLAPKTLKKKIWSYQGSVYK